jgi:LmbE family N-acetylglucosaminyl deacetylase
MRVLAVCAHPDDEVYTCGGTLAVYALRGAKVFVLILTEGCSSQYANAEKMIRQKRREAEKARSILGVSEIFFSDLPDMKLDTLHHVELNAHIEETVRDVKPELVLTHHLGDMNLDHSLAAHSTLIAARPASSDVKTVASYEGAPGGKDFRPNWFVDISGEPMRRKLKAVRAYASETRKYPHFRSTEAIEALAKVRGAQSGFHAAEAFEIIRTTGLK